MVFRWRSRVLKFNFSIFAFTAICLTGQFAWANDKQQSASDLQQLESQVTSQTINDEQIDRVGDLPQIPTTIKPLLAQENNPVAITITGVQIKTTENGVAIVLESSGGTISQPITKNDGNTVTADIPNVTLALSEGKEFQTANPVQGISQVSVKQIDGNKVRVSIIGTDGLPAVSFVPSTSGLTLNLTAAEVAEADEIEVVVTGEQQQRGYRVPNASTATKTDTPLRDIPFSVQVVPEQVLRDRKVRRLTDAFQGVSGVTTNQPETAPFESFIIRGFNTGNFTLRNGLLDTSTGTAGSGLANVDRVEFLKGPAGALFGQGSPGGTINIVTKRPLSQPFYDVETSIGNFNSYEGKVDLSGSLNEDKTLLYRLTASANAFRGFNEVTTNNRYFISPVLTWLIDNNTKITFEAEYLNTINPTGSFLPAIGTILPNPNGRIPYNLYTSEPSVDVRNISVLRIGYDLEHRLGDDWQLRNAFRASFERNQSSSIFVNELLEDNRTLTRDLQVSDDPSSRYQLDTYVVGNFKTGSLEHKLLVGFNLFREDFPANGTKQFSIDPIDLFNPVYGSQTVGSLLNVFFKGTFQRNQGLGIYLQDQITIAKNLKVLVGGRFDILSQSLSDDFKDDGDDTSFQQDQAFSPRVGVVYQPSENISIYGSYTESFQAISGKTFSGDLFKPERGKQYEVGIKADWLEGKLSTTLAFYQITRSNVSTNDPDNPGFQIQTGEQRSQGIELDVAGEILPGLKIIAGYAYTDVKLTKDNTFTVGNRIDGVPEHSFSLFATYEIQEGGLKGLGFGLGLAYVGDRPGNLDNTFTAPSFLRTDAALYYRRDKFRAALNINNLFNREYFRYVSGNFVEPGSPLQAQFTLGWEF
jgi:iron complex outermembrane recepter protein